MIKVGDTVKLLTMFLEGTKARVLAVSPRTGGITVQLLQGSLNAPTYRSGDRLHLQPYEVEVLSGQ